MYTIWQNRVVEFCNIELGIQCYWTKYIARKSGTWWTLKRAEGWTAVRFPEHWIALSTQDVRRLRPDECRPDVTSGWSDKLELRFKPPPPPTADFPVASQVWSLTQLWYSVGFSQSRIGVKKCIFNNQGLCASFFWRCPGNSAPSVEHLQCPCISEVLEARHEESRGPLKGAVPGQKSPSRIETETRELLGGTEENSVSSMRCPPGKSVIFYKKETEKNWVIGQTW